MGKEIQDTLFDCLKDIIYNPDKAELNVDDLPESYHKLGNGLLFLAECVKEQKLFAKSLVRGEFEDNVPGVENGIAAPLKEVHGILKHVVWQTKQVAKGDYSQHLDYFGDFSDSFNMMVIQLKERQENLEIERDRLAQQNEELVNLQNMFKDITINAPYRIIAIDEDTKEITYLNNAAKKTRAKHRKLFDKLYDIIISINESQAIIKIDDPEVTPKPCYYKVSMSGSQNHDDISLLFVIKDVTDEVNEDKNLEKMAYMDELTGLTNRRYGMNYINELREKNEPYAIAFIDIDYLKYCNDEFGHELGDKYIIEVAETLQTLGQEATICRIGGDEFMVIKPNSDEKSLTEELAKIRNEFVRTMKEPFKKSFSYGVDARSKDDERFNTEILTNADEKMYQFKFANKKKINYKDNRK